MPAVVAFAMLAPMANRYGQRVAAAIAGVLAIALVAAGAVLAVDAWRAASARPGPCATLLTPPRGELVEDADLQVRAWAALTDPDVDPLGLLDGSRPVQQRSCLLYAGRFSGADPTVVYAETTRGGDMVLLRLAEVRVPARGPAQVAVSWQPVRVGSELRSGVVLPLTGTYLAPAGATGVRVFSSVDEFAGTPARAVAAGAYDLGVVPDRTLAPADQRPETPAALRLEGPDVPFRGVVVPAPTRDDGRTSAARRPVGLYFGDGIELDEGAVRAAARVLPVLTGDPGFALVFDHAPGPTSFTLRIGPTVVLDPDGAGPHPGFGPPAAG